MQEAAGLRALMYRLTKPLSLALEYAIGYSDPVYRRCSLEDAVEHVTAMPDRNELLASLGELSEVEQDVVELDAQIAQVKEGASGSTETTREQEQISARPH